MNRDCSGKLGLMLHDEELSEDTISGPIAPFLLRLYERTYHRDLFTSLLIINDAPYRCSYRQPVAVKSTTSSITSFTSRDLRVPPWERQKEKIHVRRPARGKGGERQKQGKGVEGWKRGKRVDRRVGTKEAHNSPRCFLVAWLSRDWREKRTL